MDMRRVSHTEISNKSSSRGRRRPFSVDDVVFGVDVEAILLKALVKIWLMKNSSQNREDDIILHTLENSSKLPSVALIFWIQS